MGFPRDPSGEWHARGRLPHWEAGETAQTINFRLADSLPREILAQLGTRASGPRNPVEQVRRLRKAEAWLDAGHGSRLLADAANAAIVQNALRHFDGARYRLHGWCVMPNHVHVVLTPKPGISLSLLVHGWKPFTALTINRRMGRSGAVWAEEYFDRVIRDENHFEIALAYVENNPVQAGLCMTTRDWPFSSAALSRARTPAVPKEAR